jgi:CBS domain-containing protein
MNVRDLMSRKVHCCTSAQPLHDAAELMRTHKLGCIPVVDSEHRPIAMLTDRDICMAALAHGQALRDIPVCAGMSKGIFTCHESASLSEAERIMRDWHVRRLPVVGDQGVLVGMLSLGDIARGLPTRPLGKLQEHVFGDVVHTLTSLSQKRS